MNDLWPFYRISPQPQAIHYSYEKAGLTVHDQPIPWNAEAVVVDARLRLPQSAGRRKTDFLLRLAGRDPVPPTTCAVRMPTTTTASPSASIPPASPPPRR